MFLASSFIPARLRTKEPILSIRTVEGLLTGAFHDESALLDMIIFHFA
jgi:hypothetical protein